MTDLERNDLHETWRPAQISAKELLVFKLYFKNKLILQGPEFKVTKVC